MKVLIIPSATIVGDELKSLFGKIPHVLIPLEKRTALDYIYEEYSKCFLS